MSTRDRLLTKLLELALSGSVAAAKLYLYHSSPDDDTNLSTGQTIALIRDTMRNIDLQNSQKISPDQPPVQNHHSS